MVNVLDDSAETIFKGEFVRRLRESAPGPYGWVVINHQDIRTAGIPDLSVTRLGSTTWLEFKRARPTFKSPGQQEMTCRSLDACGRCFYIMFETDNPIVKNIMRTLIIRPRDFPLGPSRNGLRSTEDLPIWQWAPGHDFKFLIDFLEATHARR